MRHGRRWILVAILLIVLGAAAYVGLKHYLMSQNVAEQVAARLEDAFGSRVEVDEADVGVVTSGSTLHNLKLYESRAPSAARPWATVQEVDADVNVWSVLRGLAMPRQLMLKGARLAIQLDKNGQLLTRLPAGHSEQTRVPDIHLRDAQIRLCQEGRPDLIVEKVNADLRRVGNRLELTGSIREPRWGEWTLSGEAPWPAHSGSIALKAKQPVHVTQEMLSGLPFVPENTWEQVQAEGKTPVEITLRLDPDESAVHYRVVLNPRQTKVHVGSIDLNAEDAAGEVIIEDGMVQLQGVVGKTADGEIKVNSEMDFRGEASMLHFDVDVENLDVRQLPPQWRLPREIEGRLTGKADLQITVADGQVQFAGGGQGTIREARIGGAPAAPLRLKLHPEGDGYRWEQSEAAVRFFHNRAILPGP